MVLKEALVRAESSEKQLRDMKQQLKETEGQLQESERHAGELIVSFIAHRHVLKCFNGFLFHRMLSNVKKLT